MSGSNPQSVSDLGVHRVSAGPCVVRVAPFLAKIIASSSRAASGSRSWRPRGSRRAVRRTSARSCTSFLALPRDFRDDGAFEDVGQNEAGVVMCRAHASGRIVDVADRHLPVVQRQIRKVVCEDRRPGSCRRRRGAACVCASARPLDAAISPSSANEVKTSRRVIVMARNYSATPIGLRSTVAGGRRRLTRRQDARHFAAHRI